MQALEKFQLSTREWLQANCPESMRTAMVPDEVVWGGRNASFKNPDSKAWLQRMAAKGWTCPTWPAEYGGGGLNKEEAIILNQELRRINARVALTSFGISMLGPVLLESASVDQIMEHIPKIVAGEIRWCQGYSEPGAGSDLASLSTRAELHGDTYTINGSKVWTSYADQADWIFCLVRTDFEVPKHAGISFILFDMASPGITTKPIQLISGGSPFCETFFDDVKVPQRNLVGRLNEGWSIAKRLLQHDRTMISSVALSTGQSDRRGPSLTLPRCAAAALPHAVDSGRLSDAVLRDQIARFKIDSAAFAYTSQRSIEESKQGQGPNATSSMLKNYGCELNKRRYELLMQALGSQGLGWEGDGFDSDELQVTRQWLRSKANSIEGGTSEIQLNVIAKRVLGLPDIMSTSNKQRRK